MKVIVIGPEECSNPEKITLPNFIDTTSHSKSYGVNFSPFFLGPVSTYPNAPADYAYNIENCWQYSKCYSNDIDHNGPTKEWYEWARKGFLTKKAIRYPRGKGAIPEYHFWDGEKLGKIEARRKIYIPKYMEAVKDLYAFQLLKDDIAKYDCFYLWCYDGYNRFEKGMSLEDVIEDEKSMGHAFVLEMMLERIEK